MLKKDDRKKSNRLFKRPGKKSNRFDNSKDEQERRPKNAGKGRKKGKIDWRDLLIEDEDVILNDR